MKTAAGIDRVIGFVTKFQFTFLSGCSVYGTLESSSLIYLLTQFADTALYFAKHSPNYNLLSADSF